MISNVNHWANTILAAMSQILNNFTEANEYFKNNYLKIQKKYSSQISEIEKIYNNLAPNPGPSLTPQQGTSLSVALRALKFAYTAADLIQRGHTQEAIIIFRNIEELRLVMLDILTSDEAYKLWRLTQKAKEKSKKDNTIDSKDIKQEIIDEYGGETIAKLTVESSIRRLKKQSGEYLRSNLSKIIDNVDILSEFSSHENIFNLVRRMDIKKSENSIEQIDIYIGVDAKSDLSLYFDGILGIFRELKGDMEFIVKYK